MGLRRRIVTLPCLVFVLGALVAPAAVDAAPRVEVSTTYYAVDGATETSLRRSIDRNRPGGYDARTRWRVSWSYRSMTRNGRCVPTTWTVSARIGFTYPRWRTPPAAPGALRQAWARYMARLEVHEKGHAANGRLAASRIDRMLRAASGADCTALDRSLRAHSAPHIAAGIAADRAYDRRTRHGATQGAVFP